MKARMVLLRREQDQVLRRVIVRILIEVMDYPPLRHWPLQTDRGDFVGLAAEIVHGLIASSVLVLIVGRTLHPASAHLYAVANQPTAHNFRVNSILASKLHGRASCQVAFRQLIHRQGMGGLARSPAGANAFLVQDLRHVRLNNAKNARHGVLIVVLVPESNDARPVNGSLRAPAPPSTACRAQVCGYRRLTRAGATRDLGLREALIV